VLDAKLRQGAADLGLCVRDETGDRSRANCTLDGEPVPLQPAPR